MQHLDGRVAVVTGAGSGIGRALALRLAREGMRVVGADVEAGALEETADLLGSAGAEFTTRLCDVADHVQVEELAEVSYDTFGAVHLLCNNAGVFAGGLLWERPREDWIPQCLGRCGISPAPVARHAVPKIRHQRTRGV